eukprot:g4497.t1 g4497   contig15:1157695-1159156(+)
MLRQTAQRITQRAGSRGFSVLTASEEFPGLAPPTPPPNQAAAPPSLPSPPASPSSPKMPPSPPPGLSSAVIVRSVEDVGGQLFARAGRRGATVGYTALRENAAFVAPLLAAECSFEKWDVVEAVKLAGEEVGSVAGDAQVSLTDQIYAAAYGAQSSLGRSYYTPGASRASIISFRERNYTLNGAVLAATGITDHEAFCRMVEEEFPSAGASSGAPPAAAAKAEYLGGEARLATSADYALVALAFEGPTSAPMMNVLKHCLNMSGGASAFASPGVMGVYGGGAPGSAAETVDALSKAVTSAPSADVVARAKAAAKAEALNALDGGSKSLADAMTASVLDSCGFSAKALGESYDAISEADVKKAYEGMMMSKLSLAAVGDITSVPYHASIASRFA